MAIENSKKKIAKFNIEISVPYESYEDTYSDFSDTEIVDDGIDFAQMTPSSVVENLQIINGPGTQRVALELLNDGIDDIAEAINALQDLYTEILIEMTPLVAGPFETPYTITVSDLMIPKTIDLEAAAS